VSAAVCEVCEETPSGGLYLLPPFVTKLPFAVTYCLSCGTRAAGWFPDPRHRVPGT
jgi:hypothetical protein